MFWEDDFEEEVEYSDGIKEGLSSREPLHEPYEQKGRPQDSTVWVPHKEGE